MSKHELVPDSPRALESASLTQLVGQVLKQSTELVKKEVELATAEVKHDLRQELVMAKGLGVAGVCALLTASMLLVAAVFGLMEAGLAGWCAALIVAGVVAAVGGVAFAIGWGKRVKKPLAKTQQTLKEDLSWAKERIA